MKTTKSSIKLSMLVIFTLAIFNVQISHAQDQSRDALLFACIAMELPSADQNKTIEELKKSCDQKIQDPITRRIIFEKTARSNPFVLLPHKPNYILPVTYSKVIEDPYTDRLQGYKLKDVEIKFQFSLKYVALEDLLTPGLDLQVAFTSVSWWQAYNSDLSAPFRETNYEPELIFSYNKPWSLFNIPIIGSSLSLNHQSNGQAGTISRSWNRVIVQIASPVNDVVWSTKAWWRVPEDSKNSLNSPKGDDNPNIEKYFGYGEFGGLWKINHKHTLDVMLRNNFRTENNKGAIKIGWSFPLSNNLRGYVEYFNGYGESLIYYNLHSERLGLGFKRTDWL